MQKIQVITFDAGGTLLYPYPSVGIIYAEVMAQHGLRLDAGALDSAFRRVFKTTRQTPHDGTSEEAEKERWREVVRQVLNGLGAPSNFEILFNDLWSTFAEPHRWHLHEGARETLLELKKRGYRLAILSNWDKRLRTLLERLDLAHYFEHMIISSEVGCEKPDPRIFRVAENCFGLSADKFLHVGDSLDHDIEGAGKAGWHCVLLASCRSSSHSVLQITALGDLPGILMKTSL